MICDTCEYAGRPSYAYPCSACNMKEYSPLCMYERKVVYTNADCIRSMNDEKLASWLARTQYTNVLEAAEILGIKLPFNVTTLRGTEAECLAWLKQPVEE